MVINVILELYDAWFIKLDGWVLFGVHKNITTRKKGIQGIIINSVDILVWPSLCVTFWPVRSCPSLSCTAESTSIDPPKYYWGTQNGEWHWSTCRITMIRLPNMRHKYLFLYCCVMCSIRALLLIPLLVFSHGGVQFPRRMIHLNFNSPVYMFMILLIPPPLSNVLLSRNGSLGILRMFNGNPAIVRTATDLVNPVGVHGPSIAHHRPLPIGHNAGPLWGDKRLFS